MDLEDKLDKKISDHIEEDRIIQGRIFDEISKIKENHLEHLKGQFIELRVDTTKVKSDVRWILIIGSFIVMESAGILVSLFLKKF